MNQFNNDGSSLIFCRCLLFITTAFILFNTAICRAGDSVAPDPSNPDINRDFQQRQHPPLHSSEPSDNTANTTENQQTIPVHQFWFKTVPEFPELGINRDVIHQISEQSRQSFLSSNTQKINDQSALMNYSDILSVANRITAFYRSKGLIFTKAYIPPQQVIDGKILLVIQTGSLGKVMIDGNSSYSEQMLQSYFSDQKSKAVKSQTIEESIYLLNDLPGLNLSGYFQPGELPGQSDLTLNIQQNQSWQLSIRADNHGSEFTGEQRIYLTGSLLNPTGSGDQLTLATLKTFDPDNTTLYQARYSLPVFDRKSRLEFFYEDNDYQIESDDPGINILGITGASKTLHARLERKLLRSQQKNLSSSLTLQEQQVNQSSLFNSSSLAGDHALSINLALNGDLLNKQNPRFSQAGATFEYGEFRNKVARDRGDQYLKLSASGQTLFLLPMSDTNNLLVVKSKLQYGSTALPSFDQMPLGGPSAVRAFTSGEFSADNAIYLGAELSLNIPNWLDFKFSDNQKLSDYLNTAVMLEGAYGNENSYRPDSSTITPSDPWAHLAGTGFLFRYQLGERLTSSLSIAKPLGSKSSSNLVGNNPGRWQTFFDFTLKLN